MHEMAVRPAESNVVVYLIDCFTENMLFRQSVVGREIGRSENGQMYAPRNGSRGSWLGCRRLYS